jgi:hypothetical protein
MVPSIDVLVNMDSSQNVGSGNPLAAPTLEGGAYTRGRQGGSEVLPVSRLLSRDGSSAASPGTRMGWWPNSFSWRCGRELNSLLVRGPLGCSQAPYRPVPTPSSPGTRGGTRTRTPQGHRPLRPTWLPITPLSHLPARAGSRQPVQGLVIAKAAAPARAGVVGARRGSRTRRNRGSEPQRRIHRPKHVRDLMVRKAGVEPARLEGTSS